MPRKCDSVKTVVIVKIFLKTSPIALTDTSTCPLGSKLVSGARTQHGTPKMSLWGVFFPLLSIKEVMSTSSKFTLSQLWYLQAKSGCKWSPVVMSFTVLSGEALYWTSLLQRAGSMGLPPTAMVHNDMCSMCLSNSAANLRKIRASTLVQ